MKRVIDRTSKRKTYMTMKRLQAKIRFPMVWFVLATAAIRSVAGQFTTNQGAQLIDREKEIAIALSACPPSVAGKAVYILDRAGYIKVRDSQNGFTVADAFAKGIFQPPAKPGIDYMLSTENLTPTAKGEVVHFPPHVMFYAPYLTNAGLGLDGPPGPDGNPDGPAFVAGEGTPQALIIVPVARRSGAHH